MVVVAVLCATMKSGSWVKVAVIEPATVAVPTFTSFPVESTIQITSPTLIFELEIFIVTGVFALTEFPLELTHVILKPATKLLPLGSSAAAAASPADVKPLKLTEVPAGNVPAAPEMATAVEPSLIEA